MIGVNRFETEEDEDLPVGQQEVLKVDPEWRHEQVRRLTQVKGDRDDAVAETAKHRLVGAYLAKDNIVEPTLQAVQAYLSIGEIVQALSKVGDSVKLRKRGGFILRLYGTSAGR